MATLRRFMDRVPLPPGAVRTDEDTTGPDVDSQAVVDRTYRLPSATPGAQLRSTLAAAGFRVVGLRHEPEVPVSDSLWSTYAGAASGDVYVRPPGTPTGVVELRWAGRQLVVAMDGSDLD